MGLLLENQVDRAGAAFPYFGNDPEIIDFPAMPRHPRVQFQGICQSVFENGILCGWICPWCWAGTVTVHIGFARRSNQCFCAHFLRPEQLGQVCTYSYWLKCLLRRGIASVAIGSVRCSHWRCAQLVGSSFLPLALEVEELWLRFGFWDH